MAPAQTYRLTGVLGGTFDPIHHGHLRSAVEMADELNLDEVLLVPAARPPHRPVPVASAYIREEMVKLAIAAEPRLHLNNCEMLRQGPSYMVDTLGEIKEACESDSGTDHALVLLLGSDAFAGLMNWNRWQQIGELAHIAVAARPGWYLDNEREQLLLPQGWGSDREELYRVENGLVIRVEVTPMQISATQIRALIHQGRSCRYLLPDSVWGYIMRKEIYKHE